MSNSGKLALQLGAAPSAARPTTTLGASLRRSGLGATRGRDRRGRLTEARAEENSSDGSGTPCVPGTPGEARREAGKGRGTSAQGKRAAGSPRSWNVPGAGRWAPLSRCYRGSLARTAGLGGCRGEGGGWGGGPVGPRRGRNELGGVRG